jgi:hypothetical protein
MGFGRWRLLSAVSRDAISCFEGNFSILNTSIFSIGRSKNFFTVVPFVHMAAVREAL